MIADITATLEKAVFSEELARKDGFLQNIDPRVKVITFLALLLAVGLSKGLLIIVALYFLTLILAWHSWIPLGFFIKRVWLFMPFFTGIVALPALADDPDSKGYATFDRHGSQELGQMKQQATREGATRFYYTGMAQAILLDRLMADVWLEELLSEAVQR